MIKKVENTLEDFFDLELPAIKSKLKKPEMVFDSDVLRVFDSVDGFANSILFKPKNPKRVIPTRVIKKAKTKLSRKSKPIRTVFFKPKHKKISKIVSIVTPSEARTSVKKIKRLVGGSKYSRKQLRASLILAGARAKALAKKPCVSMREKKELRQVANIYFKGARMI